MKKAHFHPNYEVIVYDRKEKRMMRASAETNNNMTPACILTQYKTELICVWKSCGCLPLVVSVHVYLYHTTEHFRPQRPHRRELKAGHRWWHNQAAEWNCSPHGRGAFQRDGIIQQDCTVDQCTRRRGTYCIITDPYTHGHTHTHTQSSEGGN